MKKIYKFMIGGIIFVAVPRIVILKEKAFDISNYFVPDTREMIARISGLIIMGIIMGGIAYAIFGRKKGVKAEEKNIRQESHTKECKTCSKTYDNTWGICLKCGKPLTSIESQNL